jgi:outer membrane lipoprotein-sorting protein
MYKISKNLIAFTQKIIKKSYVAPCYIAFFIISFSALPSPAHSQNAKYLEQYRQELTDIENFLNNIKNLSARFVQKTENSLVEGKFFLSRSHKNSGKMRIEYLTQPKIVIVVNGPILSYYDVELDEISKISTNTTPASFLTRSNISFDAKDVEITNVKKNDDEIKVSVVKKNRKEAGEFSLIFKLNPLNFTRMEVKNDLDQTISVQLKNIDFESKISDKLFILNNSENE